MDIVKTTQKIKEPSNDIKAIINILAKSNQTQVRIKQLEDLLVSYYKTNTALRNMNESWQENAKFHIEKYEELRNLNEKGLEREQFYIEQWRLANERTRIATEKIASLQWQLKINQDKRDLYMRRSRLAAKHTKAAFLNEKRLMLYSERIKLNKKKLELLTDTIACMNNGLDTYREDQNKIKELINSPTTTQTTLNKIKEVVENSTNFPNFPIERLTTPNN